ncbi:MAG: alpha/beta fold hydrolase, partial [Bacteroidota bacterium]
MRLLLKIIAGVFLLLFVLTASLYRPDLSITEAESRYRTPTSQFLDIEDARVHVRIRGSGPALFLIHGSFSSLHTWQPWEDSLSTTFTTVSMDLPGHGLTGPNKLDDYSQEYYVRVVFGIADRLGIDTFAVAGNSMGGNVAYRMALNQPRRITKLVLIDAAGPPAAGSPSTANPSGSPFIFRLLSTPVLSTMMVKCTPKFLFRSTLKDVYGDPERITDAQVDRYYDLILREGNRVATLKRIRGIRSETPSGKVDCPTFILWGEQDRWIPVAVAKRFHEAIPESQLTVMK